MERNRELAELLREWHPPAELTLSSPREVKLAPGGIGMMCFSALLVLGAIAAGVGLSRLRSGRVAQDRILAASGVETQAVITRHFRTEDKSRELRITYQFERGGRTYRATTQAPSAIWEGLSIGSTIAVRFAPDDPAISHPVDWDRDEFPAWMPAAIAAAFAAIAMSLQFLIRRQKRLLSEGRAAPAVVVGHRRIKGGQMLNYEFPLTDGGVLAGRGGNYRRPPAVGSTITVLYDRDKPRRNAPYPLDLVRVAR